MLRTPQLTTIAAVVDRDVILVALARITVCKKVDGGGGEDGGYTPQGR